jgi:hypothetical protein
VTDDGKLLLAHCFNCGGSGAIKWKGWAVRPDTSVTALVQEEAALVKEIEFNIVDYDYRKNAIEVDGNDWPLEYFKDCMYDFVGANKFGIRKTGMYYMIPRGYGTNVTGYDLRYYPIKSHGRIIHPDHAKESKLLVYNPSNSKTAVIAEDPISAMKLSLAGFAGISLCSNHLNKEDAWKLAFMYDKLVVWLDNDSKEIIKLAHTAKDRLALYNDNVHIVTSASDPKHYKLVDIQCILKSKVLQGTETGRI